MGDDLSDAFAQFASAKLLRSFTGASPAAGRGTRASSSSAGGRGGGGGSGGGDVIELSEGEEEKFTKAKEVKRGAGAGGGSGGGGGGGGGGAPASSATASKKPAAGKLFMKLQRRAVSEMGEFVAQPEDADVEAAADQEGLLVADVVARLMVVARDAQKKHEDRRLNELLGLLSGDQGEEDEGGEGSAAAGGGGGGGGKGRKRKRASGGGGDDGAGGEEEEMTEQERVALDQRRQLAEILGKVEKMSEGHSLAGQAAGDVDAPSEMYFSVTNEEQGKTKILTVKTKEGRVAGTKVLEGALKNLAPAGELHTLGLFFDPEHHAELAAAHAEKPFTGDYLPRDSVEISVKKKEKDSGKPVTLMMRGFHLILREPCAKKVLVTLEFVEKAGTDVHRSVVTGVDAVRWRAPLPRPSSTHTPSMRVRDALTPQSVPPPIMQNAPFRVAVEVFAGKRQISKRDIAVYTFFDPDNNALTLEDSLNKQLEDNGSEAMESGSKMQLDVSRKKA
jgi:hypothetical protein